MVLLHIIHGQICNGVLRQTFLICRMNMIFKIRTFGGPNVTTLTKIQVGIVMEFTKVYLNYCPNPVDFKNNDKITHQLQEIDIPVSLKCCNTCHNKTMTLVSQCHNTFETPKRLLKVLKIVKKLSLMCILFIHL